MGISDWSSDVCSSDLAGGAHWSWCDCRTSCWQLSCICAELVSTYRGAEGKVRDRRNEGLPAKGAGGESVCSLYFFDYLHWHRLQRSEERRVGKECVRTCRYRWSRYH